jgi:SAM-dependent methyltransferase
MTDHSAVSLATAAPPVPAAGAGDARAVAISTREICGTGRALVCGPFATPFVAAFRDAGFDVECLELGPAAQIDDLLAALGAAAPPACGARGHFDVVLAAGLTAVCTPDAISSAVRALWDVGARFLRVVGQTSAPKDRHWWQSRFFEGGFRVHPLSMRLFPYDTLERPIEALDLVFERIPGEILALHPLAALKAERDLHMDMLRESGRRAEAHQARYVLATTFICPGDRVVDAACGLGYGAAILLDGAAAASVIGIDESQSATDYGSAVYAPGRPHLRFVQGDAQVLSMFPDAGAEVLVSFETLEHVQRPDLLIDEAFRVLSPGGRVICSVPNRWVDEHGNDPNPYHLHVFSLERLLELFESRFEVEHVYAQTAGGAMVLTDAARALKEVTLDIDGRSNEPAEWWLLVARKLQHAAALERLGSAVARARARIAELQRRQHVLETAHARLDGSFRRLSESFWSTPASRRVVVFGAGSGGQTARLRLEGLGWRVAGFVDNSPATWGSTVAGLEVRSPASLQARPFDIVAVASVGHAAIAAQLEGMGFVSGRDFLVFPL